MIIHWAGENSDLIIALTKDIHPTLTSSSTSSVYVSNDYGTTFVKKSLKLSSNGDDAIIDKFYNSPVRNTHVSALHSCIFVLLPHHHVNMYVNL